MDSLSLPPSTRTCAGDRNHWRIEIARPDDRASVNALRRIAYRHSPQFTFADLRRLDWNTEDDRGVVVVARDPAGAIQSTARMNVFLSRKEVERAFEYSLDGIELAMPTLALSRAATTPIQRSRGLMAHLRWYCLSAAILLRIESVAAVIFQGAPRTRSMAEAGFTFYVPRRSWDTEVVAHSEALIAALDRSQFQMALRAASVPVEDDLRHIDFDMPALRKSCAAMMHAADRPTPARADWPRCVAAQGLGDGDS